MSIATVAAALVGVRLGGVAITEAEAVRLAEKIVEQVDCTGECGVPVDDLASIHPAEVGAPSLHHRLRTQPAKAKLGRKWR